MKLFAKPTQHFQPVAGDVKARCRPACRPAPDRSWPAGADRTRRPGRGFRRSRRRADDSGRRRGSRSGPRPSPLVSLRRQPGRDQRLERLVDRGQADPRQSPAHRAIDLFDRGMRLDALQDKRTPRRAAPCSGSRPLPEPREPESRSSRRACGSRALRGLCVAIMANYSAAADRVKQYGGCRRR